LSQQADGRVSRGLGIICHYEFRRDVSLHLKTG
jgi:hypothetical protein